MKITASFDAIIDDPRLSDEDKIKRVTDGIAKMLDSLSREAISKGYVRQDDVSVANIHPSTALEISDYYEELYNKIENYPVVPTWNQSSNPVDILYGVESW